MNSRRELLMAGMPDLDDRAFVRHGRNIRPQVGGGSKAPKQPTHTTQTVNNVPAFIQPYVESMLGRTQALSTGAQFEPFDPSQRFEGTTPLQQQSYDRAAGMATTPELDAAGNLVQSAVNQAANAGADSQGLMNTALFFGGQAANMGNQYNQMATDPSQVGSFMSPYMQNVVDIQKQQAIRDYRSQLPHMQAAATNAGALGGSRHAILEAEGQRNLNQNLADIQARGTQSAYEQALQSMQFGQNLGMQGYQTGLQGVGQGINAAQLGLQGINTQLQAQLQGANTLGQLGQTRFNQNMGITELLNAMGTQQQQQGQQRRDFEYQQFLDELNFPYQQLAFMSDMTRGLPLSQSTVYQNSAQPNMTAQLIGGGLAAYGLMNRAKGGIIPKPKKKYAEGGQVDGDAFAGRSVDETTAILQSLSDQELAAYAATVQDAVTLSLIQAETQRRQRMRQQPGQMPQSTVAQDVAQQAAPAGIAAMMQPTPEDIQRPQPAMRAGGIVALAEGGSPRLSDAEIARRDRLNLLTPWAAIADSFGGGPYNSTLRPAVNWVADSRVGRMLGLPPELLPRVGSGSNTPYRDMLNEAMGPPIQVDIAGVTPPPAQDAVHVPGTGVTPQVPGESPEERGARVFGPLEESLRNNAPATPAPVQGGGSRAQGPAAAAAQQIAADQATSGAPKTFEEYLSSVDQRATRSLEEKMLVDAMRAGLDERQARVAAQENRGKMDALIAAGAAMMRGTTLAEGLALGSEAGAAALRDANATQQKLEEGLARAQEEQARYELALRKDNEKTARDAYDKWLRYDQQNTQWAAELKLKQAALAQDYQLGMAKVGAMGGAGGVDYRKLSAYHNALRNSDEAKEYRDLRTGPLANTTLGKQRLEEAERKLRAKEAQLRAEYGIPPLGDGGYDSGGNSDGWSIVE